MDAIRAEDPPCNVMGTSRYVVPDTPGIRRRNELNARRARTKHDAARRRQEVWDLGRAEGWPGADRTRAGWAAYIDVLDESGVWPRLVGKLRSELLRDGG